MRKRSQNGTPGARCRAVRRRRPPMVDGTCEGPEGLCRRYRDAELAQSERAHREECNEHTFNEAVAGLRIPLAEALKAVEGDDASPLVLACDEGAELPP